MEGDCHRSDHGANAHWIMDGDWPARADEGGASADNMPPTTVTRFVGGGI